MSLIGTFQDGWKRFARWLSQALRPPYPSMARHTGGAGALLIAVMALVLLAEPLGWLRELPDTLDAVLIGSFITAVTGVILLANTRTLDETGTREVLAVELDQISERCSWPSNLTPVETQAAHSVRAELLRLWKSPLSLDGLESARPKLFLLSRELIAQVLELYRALEEHYPQQEEVERLRHRSYTTTAGVGPTAKDWDLDLPASKRAQISYSSAVLAQTLSPTEKRQKRLVQLHEHLKEKMPEALAPL